MLNDFINIFTFVLLVQIQSILSFSCSLKYSLDSEDVFHVKQHRSVMFHVPGVQLGASRACLLEG